MWGKADVEFLPIPVPFIFVLVSSRFNNRVPEVFCWSPHNIFYVFFSYTKTVEVRTVIISTWILDPVEYKSIRVNPKTICSVLHWQRTHRESSRANSLLQPASLVAKMTWKLETQQIADKSFKRTFLFVTSCRTLPFLANTEQNCLHPKTSNMHDLETMMIQKILSLSCALSFLGRLMPAL